MGRPTRFSRNNILEAAKLVVADKGPTGLTLQGVAAQMGGPTGSIYHRFRSKDQLLAELWLFVYEGFTRHFTALLSRDPAYKAGLEAVAWFCQWVNHHPQDAALLVLYGPTPFLENEGVPPDARESARRQKRDLDAFFDTFVKRLVGEPDQDLLRSAQFCLLQGPMAAARPFIETGQRFPESYETMLRQVYEALLAGH